jgi:hypothetical protein
MTGADIALAMLINRAANVYLTQAPAYITYREHTHVDGALGHPPIDIDRSVSVRVADDFAVMQDLPQGAVRTGEAFPVIPFFDPFSSFKFSYFANLKRLDITFDPGQPYYFKPAADDPSVNVVIPYFSFIAPRYAPGSSDDAPHFLIDPTPRLGDNTFFWSDVRQDAASQLPSEVTLQVTGAQAMTIVLDYAIVDGHWVITKGSFTGAQRVLGIGFTVHSVTTYSDFTFPEAPPDPRLAGTPSPRPTSSATP